MSDDRPTIEALQVEERTFPPPADLAAAANAKPGIYERAAADPAAYWAEEAKTGFIEHILSLAERATGETASARTV